MKYIFIKTAAGLAAAATVLTSVIVPIYGMNRIACNYEYDDVGYGDQTPVDNTHLIKGRCYIADRKMVDKNPAANHSKHYVERSVFIIANAYRDWEGYFIFRSHPCLADVIDCENVEKKTIYTKDYTFYLYDRELGPALDFDFLYHVPLFNS